MPEQLKKESNILLKLKERGLVVFYKKGGVDRERMNAIKLPYEENLGEHASNGCNGALYRESVTDSHDAIVCKACGDTSTMFPKECKTYGGVLQTLRVFKEARSSVLGQGTGVFQRFQVGQ
jgi:hypothetical protein